jgi:hypothetical protein
MACFISVSWPLFWSYCRLEITPFLVHLPTANVSLMEIAILQTDDKSNLKLLIEVAHEMGVTIKVLSENQKEDLGMGILMRQADRSEKVPREEIMKKLKP